MNFNEATLQTEENMMETIRGVIPKIVEIRLASMEMRQWLDKQGTELANANEDVAEAIEALYKAETAMGNAHQSLLVTHSTQMIIKNAEK